MGAFAGLVLLTLSVWGGVRLCRFRRAIINVAPLIPGHPIPMGFHPVGFQNPAGPSVSPPSRPAGSSSSAAAGTSPIPQGIPAAPSGPAASVGPAAPSVGDSSLLADFLRDEQAASRTAADVVSFLFRFLVFSSPPRENCAPNNALQICVANFLVEFSLQADEQRAVADASSVFAPPVASTSARPAQEVQERFIQFQEAQKRLRSQWLGMMGRHRRHGSLGAVEDLGADCAFLDPLTPLSGRRRSSKQSLLQAQDRVRSSSLDPLSC